MATTGCSGWLNAGSSQKRGGSWLVAARNAAYWALVTGMRATAKASSQTRCAGRSSGRPRSSPMRKAPAGTSTRSGSVGARVASCVILGPGGESYGQGRPAQTGGQARLFVRVRLADRRQLLVELLELGDHSVHALGLHQAHAAAQILDRALELAHERARGC